MATKYSDQMLRICNVINETQRYEATLYCLDRHLNPGSMIQFGLRDCEHEKRLELWEDLSVTWGYDRLPPEGASKPQIFEPRYCVIDVNDPERAAKDMMRLVDAFEAGHLPLGLDGAHAGEQYLCRGE